MIKVGDIAFEGHTNEEHAYGRFVLNDAGDGLMSPRFTCLRPVVEQRYSFWKYYIPYEPIMRPVLVNATKSGTMMNELVPDDLMRESILVPSLGEQKAIGALFSRLDNLIALHQREPPHSFNTDLRLLSDKAGERAHDQIDVLVLELLDDVKVGLLRCVHARVAKALGDTRDRDPRKEQERSVRVA